MKAMSARSSVMNSKSQISGTAFTSSSFRASALATRAIRRSSTVAPICAFSGDQLKQSALAAAAAIAIVAAPQSAQALCPDLVSTPSGLKYCDVKVGSGDAPVKGAFIKVHYNGRLDSDSASGTFDSSYERGRPLGFAIGTGQVIKGWDMGVGGGDGVEPMLPGGKRQLVIPPELGYGNRAVGPIPANSTLYFDVELIGRVGKK